MRRRSLCAIAATTLLLAGCGSSGSHGKKSATTGSTITGRLALDPTHLDPAQATSEADQAMQAYLYDGLVNFEQGKVESGIASKWNVTPTKAVFTLRTDVTCSDGTKVTPSIVKQNFDRLKNPATKAPYTGLIFGSSDYTVAADDAAGTVTVDFPKPNANFLNNVGGASIVCPTALKDPASLATKSDGTGPFVLQSVSPGNQYVLTTRKGYDWGPNGASTSVAGFPAKLVLKVIANDSTAANLLLTGGLNFAGITGSDRQRLASQKSLFQTNYGAQVFGLFFNEASGHPTADMAVRKALAQAISPSDLREAAFGGFGEEPKGLLLPQAACAGTASSTAVPGTDVDAAKAALAGKHIKINLIIPDLISPIGAYLQSQWSAVGVSVHLTTEPATQVVDTISKGGGWDITSVGIGATSASAYLGFFTGPPPPGGANFWSVNDSQFASLGQQANSIVGDASCPIWNQALTELMQNVHEYPFGVSTTGWFGKNVKFVPSTDTAVVATSLRVTG